MAKKNEDPKDMVPASQATEVVVFEDYGDDAGKGFEGQGTADKKIAWLVILQPGSPQVTERKHPMALAGNIYNTATDEYYDGKIGVVITPCANSRKFVRWAPRTSGGGMISQHDETEPFVQASIKLANKLKHFSKMKAAEQKIDEKTGKVVDTVESQDDLVDTRYMPSVLHCDDGRLKPVMMGFKSTHIKPYRDLNSKLDDLRVKVRGPGNDLQEQRPPYYANRVRMTTEFNKEDGNSWYTPKFEPADGKNYVSSLMLASDPALAVARKLGQEFNLGQVNVNYEDANKAGSSSTSDEDIPF